MEQGEGAEKEEEQVDSRELILLSSEPAESLAEVKEFDVYVHLTHTVLQCLLHITQDSSEVYNINKSLFFFFFLSLLLFLCLGLNIKSLSPWF